MDAYYFTANSTRSRLRLTPNGSGGMSYQPQVWTASDSAIVCANNADQAQTQCEDWLCAHVDGQIAVWTKIHGIVAVPFPGQLLTETGLVATDWPRIAEQARLDLESTAVDDSEQGYWVDVDAVVGPSSDLEALRRDLPEDVSSGLNWVEDKKFFYLLSVLNPPPPPAVESEADIEDKAPSDEVPPEETTDEDPVVIFEPPADFPGPVDKGLPVLIRARNSVVAAWLWRTFAANTALAGNPIRIEPLCVLLGAEGESDWDAAIAEQTKAIELNPDDASAYYLRSRARCFKGDMNGAMDDANKAIELNPKDAAPCFSRGLLKAAKSDFNGAITDYNKSIELRSDDATTYCYRGFAKRFARDSEGAIADFNKAIELRPQFAYALVQRGVAKKDAGDLEGAMVDYSKAIAAHPKYAWPYHARGCLQYDAHEFTEALADFQKVLELDYSHQDYSTYRIWLIRTRLGEPDDAATALQSYLARGATKGKPEDWSIITVNFLAGQLAELDFLAAAKNEDPKKEAAQLCQAFFYAGSKRLFEGDKATARAYFQKSIATNEKRCTEYCSALAELKLLGDQEN